jgi:hypothetical protein
MGSFCSCLEPEEEVRRRPPSGRDANGGRKSAAVAPASDLPNLPEDMASALEAARLELERSKKQGAFKEVRGTQVQLLNLEGGWDRARCIWPPQGKTRQTVAGRPHISLPLSPSTISSASHHAPIPAHPKLKKSAAALQDAPHRRPRRLRQGLRGAPHQQRAGGRDQGGVQGGGGRPRRAAERCGWLEKILHFGS